MHGLLSSNGLDNDLLDGLGTAESSDVLNIGDWSAYDTVYDWSGTFLPVPSGAYGTFLDIVGEGFLVFFRADSANSATRNPNVKITVDGVVKVFEGITFGATYQGNLLLHPIYYKYSLKVEVFNGGTSSANLVFDYTYLKKNNSNTSKTQTILSASNRKMAYSAIYSGGTADVVNINGSGYLLGIEFSGYYTSSAGTAYGALVVDSLSKMNERITIRTGLEPGKIHTFNGPIRFNSNLKISHRIDNAGSSSIVKVWYVLD